ncbi:MAG: sodium:calcium antiporter [Patescibacteria group bacterium]
MIGGIVIAIIIFSLLLIKGADWVIVAIRRISLGSTAKAFTISAIVLALGTSFPELFVGITSALEGTPSLSLGVVAGSNIANITLVGGLAALIVGRIRIHGEYLKREVWIALVAGLLPSILLIDGQLSRVDGLILLAVYGAYSSSFFRQRFIQIGEEQSEEGFVYRFVRRFSHITAEKKREIGRLFVGLALMLFSADMIVKLAIFLGDLANVPNLFVGLVIVAIGTSLPELAFSLRSLKEHEPSMFIGNLLGSTIVNSTLVLGMVSLIQPIVITALSQYYVAVFAFFAVFLSFWFFIRSKHRMDRWEAGVLLLLYLAFVLVELF